jgi:hypothetical protein
MANITWGALRRAAFIRNTDLAVEIARGIARGQQQQSLAWFAAIQYGVFLSQLFAGDLLDEIVEADSPPAEPAAVAETVARFILEGDDRIDRRVFADWFVYDVLSHAYLAHLLPLIQPACSEGRIEECLRIIAEENDEE